LLRRGKKDKSSKPENAYVKRVIDLGESYKNSAKKREKENQLFVFLVRVHFTHPV